MLALMPTVTAKPCPKTGYSGSNLTAPILNYPPTEKSAGGFFYYLVPETVHAKGQKMTLCEK